MKRKIWKVWRENGRIVYRQTYPVRLSERATATIRGLVKLQERAQRGRPWISPELCD